MKTICGIKQTVSDTGMGGVTGSKFGIWQASDPVPLAIVKEALKVLLEDLIYLLCWLIDHGVEGSGGEEFNC